MQEAILITTVILLVGVICVFAIWLIDQIGRWL